jgi:hypothetical protein
MATGIILPSLGTIAYSASSALIVASQEVDTSISAPSLGPWTPPQWSQPALTMITVPPTVDPSTYEPGTPVAVQGTNYVFDAVIRASHRRRIHKTQHPVLTGANISDHAYIEPASLTLEIGMSDAMAAFASSGQWTGPATKSVNAWQILKALAQSRTLLTVTTRLDTYYNMLLEDNFAADEAKTLHGLRATLIFGELIAASVSSQSDVSARPQTSDNNPAGVVQGTAGDPSVISQHTISDGTSVSGAGKISSNSLSPTVLEF